MDRYFCINGEEVKVKKNPRKPGYILVFYHGKVYERPKTVLGTKLFRNDPTAIGIGCIILLEEADAKEPLRVHLTASKTETKYQAMGGSYYGAKTKELSICPEDETAGISVISDDSPLGRALLGKKPGASVSLNLGDHLISYRILSFESP